MINWQCSSVVERMLCMYEVLGSIPSISKHRLMFNDFYANLRKSISLLPCKVPTDGFIVFVNYISSKVCYNTGMQLSGRAHALHV